MINLSFIKISKNTKYFGESGRTGYDRGIEGKRTTSTQCGVMLKATEQLRACIQLYIKEHKDNEKGD